MLPHRSRIAFAGDFVRRLTLKTAKVSLKRKAALDPLLAERKISTQRTVEHKHVSSNRVSDGSNFTNVKASEEFLYKEEISYEA